jgi:predicted nucleic acid-binding Zn ribbon protein
MGMFDSVMVPCPECGTKSEFQSKSGDCLLSVYELDNCPPDVMQNVNRHSPNTCEKCGTVYAVKVTVTGTPVKV